MANKVTEGPGAKAVAKRPGNIKSLPRTTPSLEKSRAGWKTWMAAEMAQWPSAAFVTLNFKPRVLTDCGQFATLDEQIAKSEVKKFGNRLDRAAYGNLVKRFNRRIRRIPVLEYGHDRGWHCHIAIEVPLGMTWQQFTDLVRRAWSECEWSSGDPDIREGDVSIAGYVTKYRSKSEMEDWSDAIIVEAVVATTKYPTLPSSVVR